MDNLSWENDMGQYIIREETEDTILIEEENTIYEIDKKCISKQGLQDKIDKLHNQARQ